MQWTGSDANVANNAGNGMQMTDRSNFIEISKQVETHPKLSLRGTFTKKIYSATQSRMTVAQL